MKKLKFVVVGYGGMGGWHVNMLSGVYGPQLDPAFFEFGGIYDIDPAKTKLAQEKGYYAYPSFEALLADKSVDVLTVAIPNDQHKDICIAAMNAKKNVICEKPVTLNVHDLNEMFAAAKRNHVAFSVHQNRRWDPDFLDMKNLYETHRLGDVFYVECRVHGSRGIPGDWRNRKECGGGMLYDWGVHLIDQMFQMVKEPVKSFYATLTYVTNEFCDDGFKILVNFESGLQYHLEVGTSNFISMPHWYMLGNNGSAIMNGWEPKEGKITMVSDWENKDAVPIIAGVGLTKTMAPRTDDSIKDYPLPDINISVAEYYKNFSKACCGEEELTVSHKQMHRVMTFVDAAFESAAEDKVIKDFEQRCLSFND